MSFLIQRPTHLYPMRSTAVQMRRLMNGMTQPSRYVFADDHPGVPGMNELHDLAMDQYRFVQTFNEIAEGLLTVEKPTPSDEKAGWVVQIWPTLKLCDIVEVLEKRLAVRRDTGKVDLVETERWMRAWMKSGVAAVGEFYDIVEKIMELPELETLTTDIVIFRMGAELNDGVWRMPPGRDLF